MIDEPEEPDLKLKKTRDGLSDGTFKYWRDGHRIRWARIQWADDGIGIRNHGAAKDLLWAIEDAWGSETEYERITSG